MEFMSLGVRLLFQPRAWIATILDDTVVRFFESGNVEQMAQSMLTVLTDSDVRIS